MDHISILTAILTLLAGIGVFLVACSTMSANLEAAGSDRLKALFAKASGSRLLGVAIGALGTAAIQSSGATTVMVIGFVNAGILSLRQAATVIYGANIGTTITGQIVALGMFGKDAISTTVVFSALAGAGAFLSMFGKAQKWKTVGGILTGFGMLFVGLNIMSGAMESFAEQDAVIQFLACIDSPLLLVALGAILTAIIQSSSVMTSIAITMLVSGLITLDQGIFLTMGSNVGSCIVAILAGFSSSLNAKRTAMIHLTFNVLGVVLFLLIAAALNAGSLSMGVFLMTLFPGAPQTQLAMFHTVFNVCTVVLVLPLTDFMVQCVERLFPEKKESPPANSGMRLYYLDDHMLRTPAVAIGQLKREIENMADISMRNFTQAVDIICTLDYAGIEEFRRNEEELNFLNKELIQFAVRLSDVHLDRRDRVYLSSTYRSVSDLERIGDYAENIVEYADGLAAANDRFSPTAVAQIRELLSLIETLYRHVIQAYDRLDLNELALADEVEELVDQMSAQMADDNVRRLTKGSCTPNVGAQFLEFCSDAERVADHLINVAATIRKSK